MQEFIAILKYLGSAVAGAGLTIAFVVKFGHSYFFKNLDHKYAERLALKNNELQADLEETKNVLNCALQQDVARYKAELNVLSGQRSRFLEKKVDSILDLNRAYVTAIRTLKDFTDTTHVYVEEAAGYFIHQSQQEDFEEYTDYEIYANIQRDRWPNIHKPAVAAVDKYEELLALKLPILPESFAQSELQIVSDLHTTIKSAEGAFYRAMGLTSEIIEPEEDMTPDECLAEFKEHVAVSLREKKKIQSRADLLLEKAKESGRIIEELLKTQG